ncbi:MAG TPA: OmpA family protein, partial [Bryobacteraceae bacterium]|nr:OmpA family protein [Bryobacteraceae bacterium]
VSPMKHFLIAIVVFGCAACSHPRPVAHTPPDPTPVPTGTPAPTKQAPPQTVANNVQPTRVVAQPGKPTTMPADVKKKLNEYLAKLEDALFDYDQSTIRSDASAALRDDVNVIREILADYPSQKLVIEGHTDERGSAEYNLGLGDRRAHAVQEFLSSMGIPGPQLAVVSYGKEKPVCTQETESCWQQNRRAHVTAAP